MKRITRRKFLAVSGKIFTVGLLAWVLPIGSLFGQAGLYRFSLVSKPFKRGDLYRKHNWAG
ncbi:MAG: hypothetical protein JSW40_01990 [Candidatus Omnitrophota bacterium]|nr:MAG: hypothetical protein JSW40_01990 [Candidatus Omnitrophota bacterium]